jgi:hypothetical protein
VSKGISQFPESQQVMVATRRLVGDTRGIGFWAAVSFFDKKKMKYPPQSKIGAGQLITDAMERYKEDASSFHIGDTPDMQTRRHQGDSENREAGNGRPHGPARRRTLGDKRKRGAPGLDMPEVRRSVPAMGSRPSSFAPGSQGQSRPGFQRGTDSRRGSVYPRRSGNQNQRPTGSGSGRSHAPAGPKLGDFFPKTVTAGRKPGYAYRSGIHEN